jgi:hypothetical protein
MNGSLAKICISSGTSIPFSTNPSTCDIEHSNQLKFQSGLTKRIVKTKVRSCKDLHAF